MYFEGGDVIFTPEEESDSVFYICQGFVSVKGAEKGALVKLVNQGSFIGDANCILGKPRSQTAVASTQCKLIKIPREEFMSILNANSQAASKAMGKL